MFIKIDPDFDLRRFSDPKVFPLEHFPSLTIPYTMPQCILHTLPSQAEILEDDLSVREVLSEGSHFGTKSLVYNTPMQWSVVAVTHMDVFSVSQRDFESVLCDHPNSRDSIASLAQEQYGQAMLIASD